MKKNTEVKECNICNEEKSFDDFYKRSNGKCRSECKRCLIEKQKIHKQKNKEKYKAINKRYYEENSGKIRKRAKDWYDDHRDDEDFKNRKNEKNKERYHENIEHERERSKKYRETHKEEVSEKSRKWYRDNIERAKETRKKYAAENREKIRETIRKHAEKNPQYRIKKSMAQGIRYKLRKRLGDKRGKRTFYDILPYTADDLFKHLEGRFKPGMSWDNYGKEWHIDHVVPDSWFDYKDIKDEGFEESWKLENLQPMWAEENMKKGNRFAG